MSTLPPVFVEFLASAAGFRAASKEVQGELTKVENEGGGTFDKIGKAGKVAFSAILGAAGLATIKAVSMAGDWQQAMTRLVTAAGESQKNLSMVSNGLLNIAASTGTSTQSVASGAYMIESAGFHGAAGLNVMKAAAQGAKIENADLGAVSNALTTAMNDFHFPASQAALVMSQLVATVGHGKMTMDDLTGSLHSVLPNAAALHISFAQVTGALATMTAQGISAEQAAQNLNHTIVKLANPTAAMTQGMAEYGISALQVQKNLGKQGLTGTFEELSKAILSRMGPAGLTMLKTLNSSQVASQSLKTMVSAMPPKLQQMALAFEQGKESVKDFTSDVKSFGGTAGASGLQFLSLYKQTQGFNNELKSGKPAAQTFVGALKSMLGDQTGLQVALHLTGAAAGTFADNVKVIGKTTADTNGNVKDWAVTSKNFNVQLAMVDQTIKVVMIRIGQQLLPIVQTIVVWFRKHITAAKDLVFGLVALAGAFFTVTAALKIGKTFHEAYTVAMKVGKAATEAFSLAQAVVARVMTSNMLATARSTVALVAQKVAAVASAIASKAMAAAQWLLNAAMDANPIVLVVAGLAALAVGLIYAYNHSETFRHIIQDIGDVFVWLWHNVLQPVVDFFANHWKAALGIAVAVVAPFIALPMLIVTHWQQILAFFEALPGDIMGLLSDAGSWLVGIGKDILDGLLTGVIASAKFVFNWAVKFPAELLLKLGDAAKWLVQAGVNALVGLWNGIVSWTSTFWTLLSGIPGDILNALGDGASWLLNVGHNMLVGLWNGIAKASGWLWKQLKGFVGDLISGIKSFLGISSPSKVMADHVGKHIATGLAKGILDNRSVVKQAMRTIAGDVTGATINAPGVGVGGTAGLGGLATTAPAGVTINLTVQGNVQTEQDLLKALEAGMLRAGMRRGVTYQGYRR